MELLYSSSFWVAIAFFTVVAIIVFRARGAVLGGAYSRIEKVSADIAHAEELREEAQKLLVQYEKEYRESLELAKTIVEDAREETKFIIETITVQADDMLKATESRSKDAILRAKLDAVDEIRETVMKRAMAIVEIVAKDEMAGKTGEKLLSSATKEIASMK